MSDSTPAKAPAGVLGEPPAPLDTSEALMWHAGRLGFRRLDAGRADLSRAEMKAAIARARALLIALPASALVRAGLTGGRN